MTQRDPLHPENIGKTFVNWVKSIPKVFRSYWTGFREVYMSSGMTKYLDDYIQQMKILVAVGFFVFFISFFVLFSYFMGWGIVLPTFLVSLAMAIDGAAITGCVLILYPYYMRREAKMWLEDGLIYFLSYMAVLSASGMTLERILTRLTEVEINKPIIHLSKKFMMNTRIFGMDVKTALRDIAEMSPSKMLARQFEGIRNTLATSGDLKSFLVYEVDRQLQVKREKLKSKINTLVYIGELYVAMMVVTPIIFIIIISVLSVLGSFAFGGSVVIQLNIIVFLGIPILGGVFIVLLDQTLGREE